MKFSCGALLLLVIAASVVGEKVRFDNYRVYEVFVANDVQLEALKFLEMGSDSYIFWESPVQTNMKLRIVVPPHKFADFEEITLRMELKSPVVIDNLQEVIDKERPKHRRSEVFDWEDYYSLDEMYKWFDELMEDHSDYLRIEPYGTSFEGIEMKAIILSKKSGNPGIFLESNIHAREWITSATATWILNQLLTSVDPDIQDLANNVDWYILPVVNPDGHRYSREVNRMWRKNRVDSYNLLCYGVDLNRNFPEHWMQGGASSVPCSDTYAGPEGASEVETKNIIELFGKYRENIDLYLSFHSYGQYMLFPYGYENAEKAENYYDWMEIAEAAAVSLSKRYGTSYQLGTTADVLYIASGLSIDWAHTAHGVPIAVTYEFRDQGTNGFILPAEQIVPNAEEVLDSLVTFVAKARDLGYFKEKTQS
ncbi:zinc carboxypeptidase-like [Wyeomyia smithii]|uniref:zinc carboxypeptidase-like n=1 Tax=Wyeomyia smithii TaxID=174621 RepID=UPI002467D0AF|nr:zinc carboxypeptidase-like [Wyeomyia smithii]